MQFESTHETAAVSTPPSAFTARPNHIRAAAMLAACVCALSLLAGLASPAGAQGSLPANACGEFEKWERGDFNPQYVDIALLPLRDATLPSSLESVVNGLAGRKFQGEAEQQAIQKLVEFYKSECNGAGGTSSAGTVAATTLSTATGAATATPAATTAPTTATTPTATTPTAGTPAPTATPATSLPNTGFNRASSALAMLGGWLLLAGVALTIYNRQRN